MPFIIACDNNVLFALALNGQPKNLGTGICVNVGFRRFADRNTEGGSLVANVVDEVSCNVFCQANTACWAVDFNTLVPFVSSPFRN